MSPPPKTLPDGSPGIGDLQAVIDNTRARIRAWPAHAREWLRSLRRPLAMREENLFLVLAVVVGLFSVLLVVCFRIVIDWSHLRLLGSALFLSGTRVLPVPVLGGFGV